MPAERQQPLSLRATVHRAPAAPRPLLRFAYPWLGMRLPLLLSLLCMLPQICVAQVPPPPSVTPAEVLRDIGIDQKLGQHVPLDLAFRDESGNTVRLRDYFRGKPVIIALVYYRCPMLCTMTLNGMLAAFKPLQHDIGDEFEVITVSFDPTEGPDAAAAKKKSYLAAYNRPRAEQGWHFLTGDETSIKALADALGYRYHYDPRTNQYAHASAIMLATPSGQLSRYFYGLEYSSKDISFALIEASSGQIGSAAEKMLLFCFQYDPRSGRYGLAIMRSLQIGGIALVTLLGTYIVRNVRRERRQLLLLDQNRNPSSNPTP